MARVFLARVDDPDSELSPALDRARAWLGQGPLPGDVRAVVAPRWGGRSRREIARILADATGRADRVPVLGRRGDTFRYQLSVGADRAHDRLEARAELYRVDGLVLAPTLQLSDVAFGPGGAVLAAARRLMRNSIDRMEPDDRTAALASLLEVAAPDLVLGDGTRAQLGLSSAAPARPLGLLLVSDDALAHDAVWARVLGLDPEQVPWMQRAAAWGLGALTDIEIGGDEPVAFFARRAQGAGRPALTLSGFPNKWQEEIGGPAPVEVVPLRRRTVASERALRWLTTLRDEPRLREQLLGAPAVAVLAGPAEGAPVPAADRVLALGPAALDGLLTAPGISTVRRWPRWWAGRFGVWGRTLRVTLEDGRVLRVAAVDDPAPSARAIRRGLAVLGLRLDGAPNDGSDAPSSWHWRYPVPAPVVHARRIRRLTEHPWRQRWQPTERLRLREAFDG